MTAFLDTCERAARAGGQVLLDWVGRFATREKAPADLVTEADLASQEQIRKILLSAYPDHSFLGEEGTAIGAVDAEYCWLVDPLDGTTNYVHQIPHYCVSIALAHRGQPICGTVFDPIARECYTTKRGHGAYLNTRRIAVSNIEQLSQAVVSVSFPPRIQAGSRELAEFARVAVAAQGVRRTGSAALNLCYIAAGRFDAYCGGITKPWDIAAGALMILEAGGHVTNPDGAPLSLEGGRLVAASTAPLHRQMLTLSGDEQRHL